MQIYKDDRSNISSYDYNGYYDKKAQNKADSIFSRNNFGSLFQLCLLISQLSLKFINSKNFQFENLLIFKYINSLLSLNSERLNRNNNEAFAYNSPSDIDDNSLIIRKKILIAYKIFKETLNFLIENKTALENNHCASDKASISLNCDNAIQAEKKLNYENTSEGLINITLGFLRSVAETIKNNKLINIEFLKETIQYIELNKELTRFLFNFLYVENEEEKENFESEDKENMLLKRLNLFPLDGLITKINSLHYIFSKIKDLKATQQGNSMIKAHDQAQTQSQAKSGFINNNNNNNDSKINVNFLEKENRNFFNKEENIEFLKNLLKIKKAFVFISVHKKLVLELKLDCKSLYMGQESNINNNTEQGEKIGELISKNIIPEIKKQLFNISKSLEKLFASENILLLILYDKECFDELVNLFLNISNFLAVKNSLGNKLLLEGRKELLEVIMLRNSNLLNKEKYFSNKINEIIISFYESIFSFEKIKLFSVDISKQFANNERSFIISVKNNFADESLKKYFSKNSSKESQLGYQLQECGTAAHLRIKPNDDRYISLVQDKSLKFYFVVFLEDKEFIKVNLEKENSKSNQIPEKTIYLSIKNLTLQHAKANDNAKYQPAREQREKNNSLIEDNKEAVKLAIRIEFFVNFRDVLNLKIGSIQDIIEY